MVILLSRHNTSTVISYRGLHLLFLSLFIKLDVCSSEGCYYSYNSTILVSPEYVDPCGKITATSTVLNCCALQANNICLSNSLCFDPNHDTYYLSPCTDRLYLAPECPQYCSNREDQSELDVVYDSAGQIWRCCSSNSDGSANCSYPTDETFSAPAPSDLSTIYPAPPSSLQSSSSTPASLSSLSSPAFSTPTTQTSTSISTSSTTPNVSIVPASISTSTTPIQPNNNDSSRALATSDIVALSVGIPGTIAAIVGAYFTYVAVRRKKR